MNEAPTPLCCGLYKPGHEVHHVMALKIGNDTEHVPLPGRVLDVSDDGIVRIEVDGEVRRYWHHEPDRLRFRSDANGGNVELHPPWSYITIPEPPETDGGYAFYLGDPDNHVPCPTEPLVGDPLDLLSTTGGFSMSGQDAVRYFADLERHRASGTDA
jgi:hypothetical protein